MFITFFKKAVPSGPIIGFRAVYPKILWGVILFSFFSYLILCPKM